MTSIAPTTTMTEPNALQSFTLFSRLPLELRRKIWNYTITPRIILCSPKTRLPVPSILHVCSESRSEGLRHYTPVKTAPWDPNLQYLNLSQDVMFSGAKFENGHDSTIRALWNHPMIGIMKNLAFSRSFYERLTSWPLHEGLWENVRKSGSLQRITVVWHRDGGVESAEGLRLAMDEDERTKCIKGENGMMQKWRAEVEKSAIDQEGWNSPEVTFARLVDE